jgi:nucleoside-diphosphate-sugar epimerase
MHNRQVLITGCAGRVGAAIALELVRDNEVHGIDCVDGQAREHLERAGVIFHNLRLGADDLRSLPAKLDYVFHQAVTWSIRNAEEEKEAYLVSVKGVVDLLKKYGDARRFVLGSTGGVCAPSDHPVKETELRRPDSTPYHSYKFAMEVVGQVVADTEGVDVITLRYYWPWSRHNGFPHTWVIVPILRGESVAVCDERPNRFTPVFMPDCVRYSIALAERPEVPRVVNVAGTEAVSIEDLARITGELLGVEPVIANGRRPMPPFLGDASLLTGLLGPPEYDVRRSLEAAIRWHRDHPEERERRDVFDAPGNW